MSPTLSKNTLVQLDHLGLLAVIGPGSKALLQGQLTCNLDDITPCQTRLGAHCNPQGRVISLFRVIQVNEGYLLQMPKKLIPYAQQALKKYAVFYKNLTLEDVSDHYNQIGYTEDLLTTCFENLPQQIHDMVTIEQILIIKVGPERYEIISPTESIPSFLNQPMNPSSVWQSLTISEGIPSIYPETSEQFLPHELNLPALQAVSFNKGCYTGQEIIARMEYRGKLKKGLKSIRVMIDMSPQRGGDIFCNGKRCGNIVDFCQLRYNDPTYDLLIIIDHMESKEMLSLDLEQHYKLRLCE